MLYRSESGLNNFDGAKCRRIQDSLPTGSELNITLYARGGTYTAERFSSRNISITTVTITCSSGTFFASDERYDSITPF